MILKPGVVAHASNFSTEKGGLISGLEASFVYILSSRAASLRLSQTKREKGVAVQRTI